MQGEGNGYKDDFFKMAFGQNSRGKIDSSGRYYASYFLSTKGTGLFQWHWDTVTVYFQVLIDWKVYLLQELKIILGVYLNINHIVGIMSAQQSSTPH